MDQNFSNQYELDDDSRSLALRVAQHEMGHYVVGRVLGFRSNGISIRLEKPRLGMRSYRGNTMIFLNEDLSTSESILPYLERRVQVLFAGAWAEALCAEVEGSDKQDATKHLEEGGATDAAKAGELINLIRNIRYGADQGDDQGLTQLSVIRKDLWNRAREVVLRERALIEGMSRRLAGLVKEVGTDYSLEEAEIGEARAIKNRFGVNG